MGWFPWLTPVWPGPQVPEHMTVLSALQFALLVFRKSSAVFALLKHLKLWTSSNASLWSACILVLRTAPRDCMTELETGCSGSISCMRGSIPQITCIRPVGLFRRIFGEYSENIPRPPYNPSRTLSAESVFWRWNHCSISSDGTTGRWMRTTFHMGKSFYKWRNHCSMSGHLADKNAEAVVYLVNYYLYIT